MKDILYTEYVTRLSVTGLAQMAISILFAGSSANISLKRKKGSGTVTAHNQMARQKVYLDAAFKRKKQKNKRRQESQSSEQNLIDLYHETVGYLVSSAILPSALI
jgi:hypothetical protein